MSPVLPKTVTLREVAPRDGFQSLANVLPTAQKLEFLTRLVGTGARAIEVGSFVSQRLLPQLADTADVLAGFKSDEITRSVMVPTARRTAAALAAGPDEIVAFMSSTEGHNIANVRRSVAESLSECRAIFDEARAAGVPCVGALAVSFGCPFEGRVASEAVLDLSARLVDAGAHMVIFGDTTGMAIPTQVADFTGLARDRLGDTPFSLHFHNNRNLAMANLYAALQEGATLFDTAIGGIGGCPTVPQAAGNLATEDVVLMLHALCIETGYDLEVCIDAANYLETLLGYPLPGQVMKSGPILGGTASCDNRKSA